LRSILKNLNNFNTIRVNMTKNNVVIGTIVAVTVALIITASTVPTVLAQQAGNMTGGNAGNMTGGGGGDLVQKMLSAAIQAKTLKTVINNKDVYVIACDPDMTDPATQCEVYTIQPAEQQP
jgi:outer membrane lipoprotein SlyB